MSRQGILACGYYGFANLGDEAVLAGLVHGLRQAGYTGSVTVLSTDTAYTQREHHVPAIPRTDIRAIWRAMRRVQVFVLGGGSLIQDVTSARSVVYYLGMHSLARRAGCRVAWIGQGIGPLRRRWAQRWTARAARRADVVVVRDPDSAELLRAMGVERVQVGADLSFLLPEADIENGWRVLQQFGVEKGEALLAMAPRRWAGAQVSPAATFQSLARYAVRRWRARIWLLPMQASRDGELVEEIATGVPDAVVLRKPLSVQEVRDVLACCRVVVGVRLHVLMLAAASGVPALALSYDPKVRAFWEPVEPKYVVDVASVEESLLEQYLAEIWEQQHTLRERVQAYAAQQRTLAWRPIDALLGLAS
ncbi:MAG: polysaccharide pyruvyl transferase CsaB [Armatimonadota bacterium]|nr:MAG: polysaccharide pyruvyl transferase CsaB [Armatimonadota bacterium]